MADRKKRLIYNHKSYYLEDSTMLCKVQEVIGTATLYVSKKDRFFIVREFEGLDTKVHELTRDEAMAFMDEHPSCIIEKWYISYFGEPEKA